MSQGMDAIAEGFNALMDVGSEPLTFRGSILLAVVDRNAPDPMSDGAIAISFDEGCTVCFPITSVNAPPRDGEVFTDANGFGMIISANGTRHRGNLWMCHCTLRRHEDND